MRFERGSEGRRGEGEKERKKGRKRGKEEKRKHPFLSPLFTSPLLSLSLSTYWKTSPNPSPGFLPDLIFIFTIFVVEFAWVMGDSNICLFACTQGSKQTILEFESVT